MIKIGSSLVGPGQPVFIVAEIGINHNGDIELAKKLIDSAAIAGCQAVKFQKRTIPVVYSREDLEKKRQIPPDNGIMANAIKRGVLPPESVKRLLDSDLEDTLNGDLKWALEFTLEEYREIDAHCISRGILWFASPWDEESVDFLEQFGPPCHKVASASLTDRDLLIHLKRTGRPIILSTGMSTPEEVGWAVNVLDRSSLVLMHSVSEYPPNDNDLHIKMVETLLELYPDIVIGYSGHEKDIMPSVISVALGACVVERHLTLDRRLWGTDHAASLEPAELTELVSQIQRVPCVLGNGRRVIGPVEMANMRKLRRKYGFAGG